MKTCDELELPCNEEAYYYIVKNKVTGEISEMLSNDYQDNGKNLILLKQLIKLLFYKKDMSPPINDFSIYKDGIDYTYSILDEENAFLLVCYNIDKTSSFKQKEINSFYEDCQTAGIPFYALCASSDDNIFAFANENENRISFLFYR